MRLFLCEKPSQGKDIARVLGATQRGSGCYTGAGIGVTWCIGHLVEAVPPEAYDERFKIWSIEHLPIIPNDWRVAVKEKTAPQYKVVEALLAQSSELVIATDADREGEMIAREVLELCGYRGPIQRLWLSALNEASIRKALGSLRRAAETERLYHSALARSRADWLIGMNMTRLFTVLGRRSGHSGVLSVGRVQTPTLRLVVDRDRAIESFVPSTFWSIEVELTFHKQVFLAQWIPPASAVDAAGRCIRQGVAQQALHSLQRSREAQVNDVQTQRVREAPPLPFDLSTLQQVCSSKLGLDVQQTLEVAQSLYETHKATTYPRTDTGYLPESMLAEAATVMDAMIASDPSIQALVQTTDLKQQSRAWDDKRVTAHHGIIPTLEPFRIQGMTATELEVYKLIRSHYLAQFLPHHEYDRTCVQLSCSDCTLEANGTRIVQQGWHSVFIDQVATLEDSASSAQALPALCVPACCSLHQVKIKPQKTKPPRSFTQGELIKAMKGIAKMVTDPRLKQTLKDTTGIGTEATRASVISGLLNRGYLYKKGRSVHASESAFTIIDSVPAAIADPATTAIWEQAFDMIENGQMTLDGFITKQTQWINQLVEHYRTTTLALHSTSGPVCPLCGASMRMRTGKHGGFWSCTRYPECLGVLPKAQPTSNNRRRTRRRPPSSDR